MIDKSYEYYRVTYDDEGVYNALKKNIGYDKWKELLNSDCLTWLPKPNLYTSKNRSYFTKEGYAMFTSKTLSIVLEYLNEDRLKIDGYNTISDKIIYSDEYQVIVEIDEE